MSTFRFTVRTRSYDEIVTAIAAELTQFLGDRPAKETVADVSFDAQATYIEINGGDRRLLHYEADVVVQIP